MKNSTAVFVSFVIEKNGDGYLASVPSMQRAFAKSYWQNIRIASVPRYPRLKILTCRS